MAGIRTIAAAVGIVNGIWGIVAGFYWKVLFQPPPAGISVLLPATNLAMVAVGIVLTLVSFVCLIGPAVTFYGSVIASLAMVGVEFVTGAGLDTTGFIVSLILMVATIVLGMVAATRKQHVSEENHPLNLPVFG